MALICFHNKYSKCSVCVIILISTNMKNVIFCDLTLFWWSLKQIEKLKSKHLENSEVMNEWMMHLYSDLLCIVVHQKRFTIMCVGGGGDLSSTTTSVQHPLGRCDGCHRTTAPVRSPHHQLQVQRRESHRANQVDALATHGYGGDEERVIEPIKWMRSTHTNYRWRGERDIEPIKCRMHSPQTIYRWRRERVIEPIKCMRSPHTSYRWRGERGHRANQVYALTPHQLQVERRERHRANQVYDALTTNHLQVKKRKRESHRANQVYALAIHQLQVERRRDIETIKCMRSPHTS